MTCSIVGITNSVAKVSTVDNETVKEIVKKAVKTTHAERALATSGPLNLISRLIVESDPSIDGEKVHLLDVTRESEGLFHVKYRVGKSNDVIEIPLGSMSPFKTSKLPGLRIDSPSLETYHSDHGAANNNDDFEELALDITNNPEKIMEVAQHLLDADEHPADSEHNSVLLNSLRKIQDTLVDMVPTINVHINNQSNRNFGEIKVDTGNVFIEKGVEGSKGLLEIYVHELYHAVTHFAINSTSTDMHKVKARIIKVRGHFLENTEADDLVRMSGNTLTEDDAEALLEHMSDPKKGLHEFVALAMTNKAVMNQLANMNMMEKEVKTKRTPLEYLLDAIASLFHSIAKKITGEPDSDDLSRMVFLVNQLHVAHKKPLRAKKYVAMRNLISVFEPITRKFSDYIDKKITKSTEKIDRNAPKEGEGDFKYSMRLLARSFYDDQAKDLLGVAASLSSYGGGIASMLSPESTVRTIIRDASDSDITQDQAEALGLLSGYIDQQRQFLFVQHSKVVLDYFSERPTLEQEEMLTSMVLDLDLSAVYEKYDMEKLLSSDIEILYKIKEKEKELAALVEEKNSNFYNAQTSLLANYMVTNTNNIALLMNADNIAKMVGTPFATDTVSKEVVKLIDEITTLKALKLSSKKNKVMFRELMESEPEGVRSLVAFQQGQNEKSLADVFPTASDKLKVIKGYSAQIMDPDVSIITAPISKVLELKSQGYALHKTLDKHKDDANATPMGLFINHKFMDTSFHRVGIRLTDKSRRGVTVTESFMSGEDTHKTHKAALAIVKLNARRLAVTKSMIEGNYDSSEVSDDNLISPTLDNIGDVVDYRYGMNKDGKIKHLSMERKISVVMGKTAASTYDKKATDAFNQQMMDLIVADAEKNKQTGIIGKNLKEYIKIEKHSNNKNIASLWRVLPSGIKVKYPEGFHVRRDLMYTYLGFREMGIDSLFGLDMMSNNSDFMKNFKHILKLAEKLWQELVKISKIDIIIRTPGVFIGNIISNFMLMYVSGYSMKEIIALKYQGVKELDIYTEGLKESITLRAKQEAGLITPKELRRLNVIENNLENSPVKDLVAEGFYTTIVEEIMHSGETGSYYNRLAKKKLANRPAIFSTGIDILYITENTKLFKLVERGIQASDFAARYAQYHLMVEGGADKALAVKTVRDNFIDYNKPNSRFVEWANKNGFVMFTKYFTRIQRVIRKYGARHPDKLILAILGQDYVLGHDLDDITDQSPISKDMGNLFYNPLEHIMRVIMPSAIEGVKAIVDGIEDSSEFKA